MSRQKIEVNVCLDLICTLNNRYWVLIPVEFIFFILRVHQHFHSSIECVKLGAPSFHAN